MAGGRWTCKSPDVRYLVTGTDAEGRSCVVEEHGLGPAGDPVDVTSLFGTRSSPPPPRPPSRAELRDLGVAPGRVQWIISRWAPLSEAATVHHTDTIDFDLVVEGSIELLLDDGAHELRAGDGAVITGVDHAWRAGADGCILSVALFGTPPPEAGPGGPAAEET